MIGHNILLLYTLGPTMILHCFPAQFKAFAKFRSNIWASWAILGDDTFGAVPGLLLLDLPDPRPNRV